MFYHFPKLMKSNYCLLFPSATHLKFIEQMIFILFLGGICVYYLLFLFTY